MSFGDLPPTLRDYSAKPILDASSFSSDTVESLRCYSTVGICACGMGSISHKTLGRVSFFGGDKGVCYIGLTKPASITLLTYDLQVASAHWLLYCSLAHIASSTPSSPGCSCGQ